MCAESTATGSPLERAFWGQHLKIEMPQTPDHMYELIEAEMASILGFRIVPSGNTVGPYCCEHLDEGGEVRAQSPAQEREMAIWRAAVGQAAGYYAANLALEAKKQEAQKYLDKAIAAGGKV